MYHVDPTPEQFRQWVAEAREAAAKAHSHNARQIQLELADTYKSLADQSEGQSDRLSTARAKAISSGL